MDKAEIYDYFYGDESENFQFYRIPRQLIINPRFKHISTDAKLLYGLMLDRLGLSQRNHWYDDQGRVFIYYKLEDIQEHLGCAHGKGVKLLAELEKNGLIERQKQGQGKPTIIYVKRFTTREVPLSEAPEPEPDVPPESGTPDFSKPAVQTSDFRKSGVLKNGSQDFSKSESNYTYMNQTESSYIYPSIYPKINSPPIGGWSAQWSREAMKAQLEYGLLIREYSTEDVDGLVELICDVLDCTAPCIRIGGSDVPAQSVRLRFGSLRRSHVEYVLDRLRQTTTKIQNIRAYLLTALYNAPVTMGHFYSAEVRHDLC